MSKPSRTGERDLPAWQTWAWNGLAMTLPGDWEMLQFARDPAVGRCVFGDRYQYRFELNWKTVPAPPDMERMVGDYRARLTGDGLQDVRALGHSPWLGTRGLDGDREVCRYGHYAETSRQILEAVFLWPPGEKSRPALEGRVLDSVRAVPALPDGRRRWQAFGMAWQAPADWVFASCEVASAQAEAGFAPRHGRGLAAFSRRGMLSEWLTVPVSEWLEQAMPHGYVRESLLQTGQSGHEVSSLVARRERPVLTDWLHGRRRFLASAWVCPHDRRLYCLSGWTHQRRGLDSGLGIALSCCPALEVLL
ncbi:MAG: hypothetical protein PHC30_01120 [Lentisphaeria bacterium]|jgi:hypothetical protein|nr:hypothetical protein [Lentisphaeria bacterium]